MSKKYFHIVLTSVFILFIISSYLVNIAGLEGFVGATSMFSSFDEIYSIREVYNILEAENFKDLVLNIIAGKGYVYGRFLYLCNAFICFIPYKIFGLSGLIFTMRLAHCLYLFAGFYLLTKYINSSYQNRIFSLLVLLVLPVTLIFMGIPKPEPLQIFLLGLFFSLKDKFKWAWLFLGLALGTKISIVFSVLFLATITVYSAAKAQKLTTIWSKGFWALIGLLIALPGLLFAVFNPFFRTGITNIIATTTKPYDDSSITFFDWIHKFFTYYYELHPIFSYALIIILVAASIWAYIKLPNHRIYIILAYLAILPIMFLTKRLWGHYLFLGTALLIPFVFEMVHKIQKYKWVTFAVFLLFMVQTIPHINGVLKANSRDKTPAFLLTKQKTEMMLAKAKLLNAANIGVDIKLYYAYEWTTNPNLASCSKDEYENYEVLILPANHNYNLKTTFKLIETENGLSIYRK